MNRYCPPPATQVSGRLLCERRIAPSSVVHPALLPSLGFHPLQLLPVPHTPSAVLASCAGALVLLSLPADATHARPHQVALLEEEGVAGSMGAEETGVLPTAFAWQPLPANPTFAAAAITQGAAPRTLWVATETGALYQSAVTAVGEEGGEVELTVTRVRGMLRLPPRCMALLPGGAPRLALFPELGDATVIEAAQLELEPAGTRAAAAHAAKGAHHNQLPTKGAHHNQLPTKGAWAHSGGWAKTPFASLAPILHLQVAGEEVRRHDLGVTIRDFCIAAGQLNWSNPAQPLAYGDEKVANRDIRVWHGATENGP
jgi:hypothetical protein